MKDLLRRFDLAPKEAIKLQKELAEQVREIPLTRPIRTVAGFDLSTKNTARAAGVVVDVDTLETVDQAVAELPLTFPYVPGLLSFREAPAILRAYESLKIKPDVLMIDGQGLLHPRRFGLACHVGVALGVPAIGVAKSPLVGKGVMPGKERAERADIVVRGRVLGVVLRTRANVKPLYISVGHLITLQEAIDLTLKLAPRYRLPEPTRRAHVLAGQARPQKTN